MALPVLVAALITAYTAIDVWTAVPWTGPDAGTPVVYKVLDAATGQPIVGARVKLVQAGLVYDMKTSTPGHIRRFGGSQIQGAGHRSLVRDTRRVDLPDTTLLVTAEGYADFSAATSTAPLVARPGAGRKECRIRDQVASRQGLNAGRDSRRIAAIYNVTCLRPKRLLVKSFGAGRAEPEIRLQWTRSASR